MSPTIEIDSPSSSGTLVLGEDLDVTYSIDAPPDAGFDRAELRIRNKSGTVIFKEEVDPTPGTHSTTWEKGKWNQPPHSGAFANPANGD